MRAANLSVKMGVGVSEANVCDQTSYSQFLWVEGMDEHMPTKVNRPRGFGLTDGAHCRIMEIIPNAELIGCNHGCNHSGESANGRHGSRDVKYNM